MLFYLREFFHYLQNQLRKIVTLLSYQWIWFMPCFKNLWMTYCVRDHICMDFYVSVINYHWLNHPISLSSSWNILVCTDLCHFAVRYLEDSLQPVTWKSLCSQIVVSHFAVRFFEVTLQSDSWKLLCRQIFGSHFASRYVSHFPVKILWSYFAVRYLKITLQSGTLKLLCNQIMLKSVCSQNTLKFLCSQILLNNLEVRYLEDTLQADTWIAQWSQILGRHGQKWLTWTQGMNRDWRNWQEHKERACAEVIDMNRGKRKHDWRQ